MGPVALLVNTSSINRMLLIRARNVGFLHYWTLSNIPLFALAAPMLAILIQSAIWAWTGALGSPSQNDSVSNSKTAMADANAQSESITRNRKIMRLLSIPQLVLAILALTNYHVQIITRLSSGYPLWYWWLAMSMMTSQNQASPLAQRVRPQVISRWMVMYAVIQGGLFASFLPPA